MAKRLTAERIRINSQGYDSRGRYWGTGAPLYRVSDSDGDIDEYVRAQSAVDARRKVRSQKGLAQPRERWSPPRYNAHAFRTVKEAAKDYRHVAKGYAKQARSAEKALREYTADRHRRGLPTDPRAVARFKAEARKARSRARRLLELARRRTGVYSRDRRRGRRRGR